MRSSLSILLFVLFAQTAHADYRVVATIKPVHGIVSTIAEGVVEPELLIDGATSPHDFSLAPSDAAALQSADLVFWIGPSLEPGLEKGIRTLAQNAQIVSLIETEGLSVLEMRDVDAFSEKSLVGKDHSGAGSHADEHDHSHETEHGHTGIDPHIWLNPENAVAMAATIRKRLSEVFPEKADILTGNFAQFEKSVESEVEAIERRLTPYAGTPFLVFHDAYQYFERRFDLAASGVIALNPEVAPGAQRLSALGELIEARKIRCLFAEPQFDPRYAEVLAQSGNLTIGTLDPLGAELDSDPEHYLKLLEGMADAFEQCLAITG